MNIAHLFLLQSELDAHIEKTHPRLKGESRHGKKVLALLVELGELANEARFFKFWSHDQTPRKKKRVHCENCEGTGNLYWDSNYVDTHRKYLECSNCYGSGKITVRPLQEEFVDGVHFLLSIGLENGVEELSIKPIKKHTLTDQFLGLFNCFSVLSISFSPALYSDAWSTYVGLAEMLGLSWDEVEAAYIEKNRKNHRRQEGGY